MLNIKILGSGCANCKRLEQIARKVAEQEGVAAEFEKVTDMEQIMSYDILSTPGLVINGQVVSSGRLPSESEIAAFLSEASTAA